MIDTRFLTFSPFVPGGPMNQNSNPITFADFFSAFALLLLAVLVVTIPVWAPSLFDEAAFPVNLSQFAQATIIGCLFGAGLATLMVRAMCATTHLAPAYATECDDDYVDLDFDG